MESEHWIIYITYLFYFVLAAIFSLLINGLLLKFSATLGNRQDQRLRISRWSSTVKPSIGGFSFYILFLLSLSLYGIFDFEGREYMNKHLLGIVLSISLGFLIGLADDAYDTYPLLKFFGQLSCGIILVATDTIIHATGIFAVDSLITLTWVVGIMNAINMLDNMDGVCGSVSLFIAIACLLVLILQGNLFSFYSIVLLGVSGALIGFLAFNWHPARLYMGDTGSQFLGAFLSAVSIQVLWKYHNNEGGMIQLHQFLIPAVAFAIPLIDTTTVFIRRIARRQSPFVGGKDHISHHFVYAGLSDKGVIYLLGGISLLSSLLTGTAVYIGHLYNSYIVLCCYMYFILLFLVTQYFYELGRRNEMNRITGRTQKPRSVAA